jgi:hypothetical protein
MALPGELLNAISADEGSKVALVLGAGCSAEAPTGLPLSRGLSEEAHRRLVTDGVLLDGECDDPSDLSKVADAVYAKCGSQRELVARFPLARFENAATNDGYDFAAALLRERALSDVMTLNFDLACRHSLAGAGAEVGVISGPEQMGAIGGVNIIHLHRDVHADPDELILRTHQIEVAWQDGWEQLVATRVMMTPIVVFVGLGTAASVLVDTLRRIRRAIEDHAAYHVDPFSYGTSAFTDTLEISAERFVQLGWSEFMRELAQRLVLEHTRTFERAAQGVEEARDLPPEKLDVVLSVLNELDLLRLGELRARWLLRQDKYLPALNVEAAHLGDLVQGAAVLARQLDVTFARGADGCLQMRRGDRVVGVLIPASGAGIHPWAQYEAEVGRQRWVQEQGVVDTPVVLAAGVLGERAVIAAPVNLIDDVDTESIAEAVVGPVFIDVDELRAHPDEALAAVR